MGKSIHICGFLQSTKDYDYEGMSTHDNDACIAIRIAREFEKEKDAGESAHYDEDGVDTSLSLPKVFLQLYFSDKEMTLEKAQENQIMKQLGILDIYAEWVGYSEYTILGYSVENFTVGGHDIEKILEANDGKYVHLLMEVMN